MAKVPTRKKAKPPLWATMQEIARATSLPVATNGQEAVQERTERPARAYRRLDIGATVKVPPTVADAGMARVVGYEWGPDNRLKGSESWQYYLQFPDETGFYVATEEEIIKWQS